MSKSVKITDRTLILDIDECLMRATEEKGAKTEAEIEKLIKTACKNSSGGIHRCHKMSLPGNETWFVIKRPGLDKFLNFASRYFDKVIVWSAAREDYVHEAVKFLFADHIPPTLILTRNEVTNISNDDYYKPLSKITTMEPGMIDYNSTLFIDDKEDNFRDFPDNGVVIPKFRPKISDSLNDKDDMLLRLVDWLMLPEVIAAHDVRKLDKKKIFAKPYSGKHDKLMSYERNFLFSPQKKL